MVKGTLLQTRKLSTKIAEHCNHINWKPKTQSVIIDHRIKLKHEFNGENIQILN